MLTARPVTNFEIFFLWHYSPTRAGAALFVTFLDHSQWHTAVGRTPLDEGSARRRDLYLITHNTHKRHTSMSPAGFEPAIPASDRPQTLALHHLATETSNFQIMPCKSHTRRKTQLLNRCVNRSWNCNTNSKQEGHYHKLSALLHSSYMTPSSPPLLPARCT